MSTRKGSVFNKSLAMATADITPNSASKKSASKKKTTQGNDSDKDYTLPKSTSVKSEIEEELLKLKQQILDQQQELDNLRRVRRPQASSTPEDAPANGSRGVSRSLLGDFADNAPEERTKFQGKPMSTDRLLDSIPVFDPSTTKDPKEWILAVERIANLTGESCLRIATVKSCLEIQKVLTHMPDWDAAKSEIQHICGTAHLIISSVSEHKQRQGEGFYRYYTRAREVLGHRPYTAHEILSIAENIYEPQLKRWAVDLARTGSTDINTLVKKVLEWEKMYFIIPKQEGDNTTVNQVHRYSRRDQYEQSKNNQNNSYHHRSKSRDNNYRSNSSNRNQYNGNQSYNNGNNYNRDHSSNRNRNNSGNQQQSNSYNRDHSNTRYNSRSRHNSSNKDENKGNNQDGSNRYKYNNSVENRLEAVEKQLKEMSEGISKLLQKKDSLN